METSPGMYTEPTVAAVKASRIGMNHISTVWLVVVE